MCKILNINVCVIIVAILLSLSSCGSRNENANTNDKLDDVVKEREISTPNYLPSTTHLPSQTVEIKPEVKEEKGHKTDRQMSFETAQEFGRLAGYKDGKADGRRGVYRHHGPSYNNPYSDSWLKVQYETSYVDAYEEGFYEVNPDYDNSADVYYDIY